MQPIIQVTGLVKKYGSAPVLSGVDLGIAEGEIVGLAGLNGAGKTTLIRCVLDLCSIDDGRIELFGMSHRLPRSRAQLAFLPERFLPAYYLTGRGFLAHAGRLAGTSFPPSQVASVLATLDFDPAALDRPVRSFSKGMTQKLGLAATFLRDCRCYLLDEPMSGLDPRARVGVTRLIAQAGAEGRAVVLTTHALADIADLCNRVMVLHKGVAFYAGTPKQLCQDHGQVPIEQAFLRCIEAPSPWPTPARNRRS